MLPILFFSWKKGANRVCLKGMSEVFNREAEFKGLEIEEGRAYEVAVDEPIMAKGSVEWARKQSVKRPKSTGARLSYERRNPVMSLKS